MQPPVDALNAGNFTLAVANHGEIRTYRRRGVADLIDLLDSDPIFMKGAAVADKVVGRAAASLMMRGGVARLYARIISRPALEMLGQGNIEVSYGEICDYVVNRRGDGMCPLEKLCGVLPTPEECETEIRKFLKNASR